MLTEARVRPADRPRPYAAGGSYTDNADVTLYAVWRYDPETYTVRYDANGGTGAPASQTKTYGVPLTLSTVKPTRAGYEFLGWSTDPTTMLTNYAPGERYTDEASVTLYAVWRYIPKTYEVKYDANGGGNTPASQTKTEDVTLILTFTIPTRYIMPGTDAYTEAQSVYATFPEFVYSATGEKYRTLEKIGGAYGFIANPNADKNERVHFIPVYVQDGSYTVSVTATQIWTPAGMITAIRNANTLTIDGTIYDDYYVGN